MHRHLAVLAAALALSAAAPFPAAAAPSAQPPTIHAAWSAAIDSRYVTDRWIARDAGSVYALREGRLEALDLRSGRTRWRSAVRSSGAPALAGDTVYLPVGGGLAALDARSGRVLRRIRAGGLTALAGAGSGAVAFSADQRRGLVARGLGAGGRVRWRRELGFSAPREAPRAWALGGDAVGVATGADGLLVLDARDGRTVAATDGIDERIGADGRYLWFSVIGGGIKGLDLATNRSLALHGAIVRGAARVEHGLAVAVVGGRLHRIDLVHGGDTPLRVDGRWIGGPAAGQIFLERGDGLYLQPLAGGRASRVAAYQGQVRHLATDAHAAYATLDDGRVYVIDLVHARGVARLDTACEATEGVSTEAGTTLIHCDVGPRSRLIALARYAF